MEVPKTSTDHLARNLNLLMEKHGLSNERLAAAIGVSNSTISRLRRGTNAAQINTLDSIGNYFKVSSWQLLLPDFDPDDGNTITERDRLMLARLNSLFGKQ